MAERASEGFADRLQLALKAVNLSPAALGSAVGVDKSVVSRWLSGKVKPSGHNLTRIAIEIARRHPGFTTLDFDLPAAELRRALGLHEPVPPQGSLDSVLSLPFGVIEATRAQVAWRGVEYFGHYDAYYWSYTQPGRIVRCCLMLHQVDGLLAVRYGAQDMDFHGWALLLEGRLYMVMSEIRHQEMMFVVTNAGQHPRASIISGIMLGSVAGNMLPTASAMICLRSGDVSGMAADDHAEYEHRAAEDPFIEPEDVPVSVRDRLSGLRPRGKGPNQWLFQVPYFPADIPP